MVKKNACVFISGYGSNLKSLINNSRNQNFPVNIRLVISNNNNAKGYFQLGNTEIMLNNYQSAIIAFQNSARINSNGFVSGFDVIDRTTVFDESPKVEIVGDGFGAFAVASLVCLDSETRDLLGYAKIGTGRYVDCPT